MTADLDIYRSAHVLIREHGADAPIHAAMRAEYQNHAIGSLQRGYSSLGGTRVA